MSAWLLLLLHSLAPHSYDDGAGNWVSALTQSQVDQIEAYRASQGAGNIRLISLFSYPSFGPVTAAYAQGDETTVGFDPAFAAAADPAFVPSARANLVSTYIEPANLNGAPEFTPVAFFYKDNGANAGVAAAVETSASFGLETLHLFYETSEWYHGPMAMLGAATNWLVRGMYVGERRIFLSAQVRNKQTSKQTNTTTRP